MNLSAVIAAAGFSSRMGAFKPLLPLGGSTVIRRTIDSLRRAGAEKIVVVTGWQAPMLEEHLCNQGVILCRNEQYAQKDMLFSIQLGLAALGEDTGRVFITPGDIPLVSSDTLRGMLAVTACVVRPSFHHRAGHPILLDRCAAHRALTWQGQGGLKGLLNCGQLESIFFETEDRAVLLDADTPEDYQILLDYEMEVHP